jgi:glycosyltransferase involved in cell wall biosynthesis
MQPEFVVFVHAYPHQVAGAQRVTLFLATELERAGTRVELVLPDEGPFADEARAVGVPVSVIRSGRALRVYGRRRGLLLGLRRATSIALFWLRLWRHLVGRRPDAVHTNDHRGVLLSGVPARLAGRPLVWHAHGPLGSRLVDQICGALASSVVAVSADTLGKLRLSRRALARKATIVHNSVTTTFQAPPEVRRIRHRVVTGARLHPDKGLDVLIDAAALLVRHIPDVRVVIAGHVQHGYEDYARALRQRVDRLGLNDVVDFAGRVANPESLWASAEVYVQPSRAEPFGLGLLEAMAAGTPVVATAVDGMVEVIKNGRNGLLVEPENASALAGAIERVLTDPPLRTSLVRGGRVAVSSHFDSARVIAQFMSIYARLAGGTQQRVLRIGNAVTLWTVQANQLRRQRDCGVELALVTDDDDYAERLRRDGHVVIPLPLSRRPSPIEYLGWMSRATLLLGSRSKTIVHTHNLAHLLVVRLLTPLMPRSTIVESIHNVHELAAGSTRTRAVEALLRATHNRPTITLFISETYRRFFVDRRLVLPSRTEVVGTGIDLAAFREEIGRAGNPTEARAAAGLPPDVRLATVVARLEPQKGHDIYLEAAARLYKTHPDVHHLLVGTGALETALRRQVVDAGIAEVVHFLGFRDDVAQIVCASDLVVLTSVHEGFGRCIVEALAAGVPVVATATDGPRLILDGGRYGLLTEIDAEAIAAAMERLIDDQDLRTRLAHAGKQRAEDFDEIPIADKVVDCYRAALAR